MPDRRAEIEAQYSQMQTRSIKNTSEVECARAQMLSNLCKTGMQEQSVHGLRTVKPISNLTKGHSRLTLPNGNPASGKLASELWTRVKARLSEMVIQHLLDDKGDHTGFISCFDSSHMVSGFHVIARRD